VKVFLCIFVFSVTFVLGDFSVIKDENILSILTPSLKDQTIAKIELDNLLSVYLISNPNADQSGAALAVKTGYWQDPKESPGLAHFLEHMLFLGTEKFPKEGEYSEFIQRHGGERNAYTTGDSTVYMFSVNNNAFSPALDRFSQFFITPLFNPSGVDREKNAVDQEFSKNVQNDFWRQLFVEKIVANSEHPNAAFNIGNLQTLKGVTQTQLFDWYLTHYSSDRMVLVLYSNSSIEEMEQLAEDYFTTIPLRKWEKLEFSTPYLSKKMEEKIVFIEPVNVIRRITLEWELPETFAKMNKEKPGDLIAFVLGHEGEGSLLHLLKKEGLATGLFAGGGDLNKENYIFSISVDLTKKGVIEFHSVVEHCFQAIHYLQKEGIPKYIFEEVKQSKTLNYQYQDQKEAFDLVTDHAQGLLDEPIETYPMASIMPQLFSSTKNHEFLEELQVRNVHLYMQASQELTKVEYNQKEPWFNVPYTVLPISKLVLKQWETASLNPKISMPQQNPFIPSEVVIKNAINKEEKEQLPEKIVDSSKLKLFWKADKLYGTPKIAWFFKFYTPSTLERDPKKEVLLDLFLYALNDQLTSLTYPASLTGMNALFSKDKHSIKLNLLGYDDKSQLLLNEMLKKLYNFQVGEEKYKIYINKLTQSYQNRLNGQPVELGFLLLEEVFNKEFISPKKLLHTLQTLNLDEFNKYAEHFFNSIYTESLLYGNLDQKNVSKVVNLLNTFFDSTPSLSKESYSLNQTYSLIDEGAPFVYEVESEREGNACLLIVEEGDFSFKERAAQEVLASILNPLFYETLRTKQQTGYIVWSWAREKHLKLTQGFAVQSSRYSPNSLLERFDLFLEEFLIDFSTYVTKEMFESVKDSVLEKLVTPPRNYIEMGQLLNLLAFEYDAHFDWMEERVKGCQILDFNYFKEFVFRVLSQENRQRIAILILGNSPKDTFWNYTKTSTIDNLHEQVQFTLKPNIFF
jgi:insulysin